jgi:hypothetical protein
MGGFETTRSFEYVSFLRAATNVKLTDIRLPSEICFRAACVGTCVPTVCLLIQLRALMHRMCRCEASQGRTSEL